MRGSRTVQGGEALRLNLGCGLDARPGWLNVDRIALPGVDFVHDLNDLPLPFEDTSAEVILCKDVLEHVELVPVLRDLHRILVPGGLLVARVPHFTAKEAFGDPTHTAFFSSQSFRYFSREHGRNYYFDFAFSTVDVHLAFNKRLGYPWNFLLEPFVNLAAATLNFYEGSPLRVFPAQTMTVRMLR